MPERRTSALGLAAFAIMTFSYLTSEMLPIGLLPRIASSLVVSLPEAGLLLSAYALVVTLAGPPLTAVLGAVPRKRLLLILAGTLVLATALCGVAASYAFLLAARLLNALAHGVFWSIVASSAASLVAPARRGFALAIVYAGSSIGIVLGVPFATFVGERLGWHAAFFAVSAMALVAFGALACVPAIPPARPSALADIRRLLGSIAFVRLLFSTTLVVIGNFTAFTYFTPLFQPPAESIAGGVPTLLLLYGVAGFASTFVFGWFANRRGSLAVIVSAAAIVAALAALAVADRSGHALPIVTIAIVIAWGLGTGGVVVSLQARVLAAQPEKPDVASALNSSAFNLGIGGGAIVGGLVLRASGLDALPAVAAILVAPAIALQLVPLFARGLRRRAVDR